MRISARAARRRTAPCGAGDFRTRAGTGESQAIAPRTQGLLRCTFLDSLGQGLEIRATVSPVWFQIVALGPFVPGLDEDHSSSRGVQSDITWATAGNLRFEDVRIRTVKDDPSGATSRRIVETRHHNREAWAVGDPEWASLWRIGDTSAPEGFPPSEQRVWASPVRAISACRDPFQRQTRQSLPHSTAARLCSADEEYARKSLVDSPCAPEIKEALGSGRSVGS